LNDIGFLLNEKLISDFRKAEGKRAVYIFSGAKDGVVPKEMQFEQQKLFEDIPFEVKMRTEPNFSHWYMEKEVAGAISEHVYTTLGETRWKNVGYSIDETYLDDGLLGKWKQQTLVDKINK
jgi:hypothetical protein